MRKAALFGLLSGVLALGSEAYGEAARGEAPANASALHCPSGRQVMIRDMHNLQVENTPDGAVIKMRADKPSEAQDVQRLARMMVDCMSEGASLKK